MLKGVIIAYMGHTQLVTHVFGSIGKEDIHLALVEREIKIAIDWKLA
jgi:hypothetical protein